MFPEWTPDGRFVTFISTELGIVSGPWGPSGDAIFFVNADGSGQPELLFRAEGRPLYTRSFSPDGRLLTIQVVNEKTGSDVTLLRLDGPIRHGVKVSAAEPLLATDAEEGTPAVSPNGPE
jgi:Tol biopolymer transport system component